MQGKNAFQTERHVVPPPVVCGLLPVGVSGGIKGGAPQERAPGGGWSASSFDYSPLSLSL